MINVIICLLLAATSGVAFSNGFWFEGAIGFLASFIFTIAQINHSSKEELF